MSFQAETFGCFHGTSIIGEWDKRTKVRPDAGKRNFWLSTSLQLPHWDRGRPAFYAYLTQSFASSFSRNLYASSDFARIHVSSEALAAVSTWMRNMQPPALCLRTWQRFSKSRKHTGEARPSHLAFEDD